MSDTIRNNIQEWRRKVADGTITQAELREAIAAIRQERHTASTASDTSRAKKAAAKVVPNGDDLLSELMP